MDMTVGVVPQCGREGIFVETGHVDETDVGLVKHHVEVVAISCIPGNNSSTIGEADGGRIVFHGTVTLVVESCLRDIHLLFYLIDDSIHGGDACPLLDVVVEIFDEGEDAARRASRHGYELVLHAGEDSDVGPVAASGCVYLVEPCRDGCCTRWCVRRGVDLHGLETDVGRPRGDHR